MTTSGINDNVARFTCRTEDVGFAAEKWDDVPSSFKAPKQRAPKEKPVKS